MFFVVEQTGWLNANAPYSGSGNPGNNGDAALDVGNSTATYKRITFGTIPHSGNVLVRIGWAINQNKQFANIQ